MKEFEPQLKPNRIRQAKNLAILDGFYFKGIFYKEGAPQLSKKEFPLKDIIEFNK